MPIYEYACESCGQRFEELIRGKEKLVNCPHCQSDQVKKLISVFTSQSKSKPRPLNILDTDYFTASAYNEKLQSGDTEGAKQILQDKKDGKILNIPSLSSSDISLSPTKKEGAK